jgi:hypothetical protein
MKRKIFIPVIGIILLGICFFAGIQAIPYGKNHINPPVVQEVKWDSPQTRQLAQRACFDCHSNETTWPWYSTVAPVSWLVYHDVEEGRQNLNFSDWTGGGETVDEAPEVVLRGRMPPLQYTIIHQNAVLSQADKELLAQGLANSLK